MSASPPLIVIAKKRPILNPRCQLSCRACQSSRQRKLHSEVAIHPPFLLDTPLPHEMVFPELLICLDCGFTEFSIPASSLDRLAADSRNDS
jgi:hypothetical protein